MSSTPFADFAESQGAELQETARLLAGPLDAMLTAGRLDPADLASQLERDEFLVRSVLEAATEAKLLLESRHLICRRCRLPMREELFDQFAADEEPAECSSCDEVVRSTAQRVTRWEIAAQPLAQIAERLSKPLSATIFCALGLERDAMVEHLVGVTWETLGNDRYPKGSFSGLNHEWSVAVIETGPLTHNVAARTSASLAAFEPKIVLFIGVAGGVQDVSPGDVAVGRTVVDVSGGKETEDGLKTATDAFRSTHEAVEVARQVIAMKAWQERILVPSPDETESKAVLGAIAVSNRVQGAETGEMALATTLHVRKAIAVEMESSGFLAAAHPSAVEALVIRGISDMRVGKDPDADDQWQPAAADHAAAFAVELLRQW